MENFIYLKMKLKSKSLSRVIEWTILKVSQCCVDWGGGQTDFIWCTFVWNIYFHGGIGPNRFASQKLRQVFTDSGA